MAQHASFLLVVNPKSGRNRRHQIAQRIAHELTRCDCDVTLVQTRAHGDAERLVFEHCRKAASGSCIVACGGDGTVQEVAHALAELSAQGGRPPMTMGVAPAGRCNDFARFLGIGTSMEQITATLLTGRVVAVDLGRVNGRHFCTVATAGIDAAISSFVDQMKMPLRGTAAYLYGAVRVLVRYKPYTLSLKGDFGVVQREVFLASTANTSTYGGAIPIVPHASITDGLLDVCVIDYQSKLRSAALVPAVVRGRHVGRKGVSFYQAKRFELDADRPIELWADGEPIARTPAVLEVVPRAISVMVPTNCPVR